MTNVVVTKQNGNIVKVVCSGHSGYAEFGSDIVCASISSIVQTAVLGLIKVLKLKIKLNRKNDAGYIEFELPKNISKNLMHDAQIILGTMLEGLKDLSEGYSKYIKLEVAKWDLLIFNFLRTKRV